MNWLQDPYAWNIGSSAELTKNEQDFIDFLYDNRILKFGEFKLKSDRRSPIFLNFGDADTGMKLGKVGKYFAGMIEQKFGNTEIDTFFGPAYKGITLASATAVAYFEKTGKDVGYTFDRKEEKKHGEGSGDAASAAKKIFVGQVPKFGMRMFLLDDVLTTGAAKIEGMEKVGSVADVKLVGMGIAANREEMDEDGNDPMEGVQSQLRTRAEPIIGLVSQAVPYLNKKGVIDAETADRIKAYVRTYGTEKVKGWSRDIKLMKHDVGIIPACDVSLKVFEEIVSQTHDLEGIAGYKLGFSSLLGGLDKWVKTARKYTGKPLIYDHQKAGTDIPDTGKDFAKIMSKAGVDAAIIFPQAGPKTEWEWIHSLFEQGVEVIVGGHMTHQKYSVSEGGYIQDAGIIKMYQIAAKAGVNNFVMPGTKPDLIEFYRKVVMDAVPETNREFVPAIYSPGLVTQGGSISEGAKRAGRRWYAIIGRGIYGSDDYRQAALDHLSVLDPNAAKTAAS